MTKYGPWDGSGVGYRYSTPPTPPHTPPPRVRPSHPGARYTVYRAPAAMYSGVNSAVGLKTVGQLTLSPLFSGLWTITEVYNLVRIDIFNNH